jgi:hypothetical protein
MARLVNVLDNQTLGVKDEVEESVEGGASYFVTVSVHKNASLLSFAIYESLLY